MVSGHPHPYSPRRPSSVWAALTASPSNASRSSPAENYAKVEDVVRTLVARMITTIDAYAVCHMKQITQITCIEL